MLKLTNISKNLRNIIGRYLMIEQRTVRINKNKTIDQLNYINYIVQCNNKIFTKDYQYGYNNVFATGTKYGYKYNIKNSKVINYLVNQIIHI
jgi:hypothetical protein